MSEIKKRHAAPNGTYTNENESEKKDTAYHQLRVFQRYGVQRIFSEILIPLSLMIVVPLSTMLLWHICRHHAGSVSQFVSSSWSLREITLGQWTGSFFALYVIGGYMAWAILLTLVLPGDKYHGPVTDKGNTPVYVNNGFRFYLITLASFIVLAVGLERAGYSVTTVCDHYGEFMFVINAGALLFCLFLYFKGQFWPSSSDNGSSGNPIFDYYWGVELYPRIGPLDLKLLTNCRWGMMVWTLVVILFWMKSLKVMQSSNRSLFLD